MIKTNSKKAREAIRAYIRENYNPEGYDEYEYTDDIHLIAHNVIRCFLSEKVNYDKRNLSVQELFFEWMAGLPTILCADYYLRSAKDLLGDILEQTEAEREKYTETQAEETMTRLIWK